MPKISSRWLILGVVVIALVGIIALFVRDAQTPPAPVALPLTQTFDKSPTGFTLKYPADWDYVIPTVGVFVLAPTQTLNGSEAGPTFTVQRAEPLSITGTLDNALNRYLQSGALRVSGRWQVTEAIHVISFEGRDARMAQLEGSDVAGALPLHTQVIATSAANTFVYLLTTTVPVSKRDAFEPTLEAMLETVQILE